MLYQEKIDKFIHSFLYEKCGPKGFGSYFPDNRDTIEFEESEITNCFRLEKVNYDCCRHCGEGESDFYVIQFNDTVNYLVKAWCGCLTYDESYNILDSGSMKDVLSTYIDHKVVKQ